MIPSSSGEITPREIKKDDSKNRETPPSAITSRTGSAASEALESLNVFNSLESSGIHTFSSGESTPKEATEHSFDPNDIDHYALTLGYGYKTANLRRMAARLNEVKGKMKEAKLEIPPFIGISHHQVKAFLQQKIPDFETRWQNFLFIETYAPRNYLSEYPKEISAEGKVILKEIRESIREAFAGEEAWLDREVSTFLQQSSAEFIIVRSTGREDSDTNANAGGNDSIPFIPTKDSKKLQQAIGDVLASYFGEKSLTQRLSAGDQTVFTEEPFFPILLQEMIFERSEGDPSLTPLKDLPRSGVLFTREEGKDPHVVTINCAFGSNEGVVTSKVTVDTFEVHTGYDRVYPIIREKETRFLQAANAKTKTGFEVEAVKNPSEAVKAHTLSTELALDLSRLGREFGLMYGADGECKAMDMEFTIAYKKDPSGKLVPTIYPLQIRPLEKVKPVEATYLSRDLIQQAEKEGRSTRLSPLLDGGSSVRHVSSPEEYIVADDINRALSEYERRGKQREQVGLIVIGKTAPLTSHEAVTLRAKSIPVLVAPQGTLTAVSERLAQATPGKPVIACSQRGVLLTALSEEEAQQSVQQGYISYPSERALTVKVKTPSEMERKEMWPLRRKHNALFKELSAQLGDAVLLPQDSMEQLFEKMAQGEEARSALKTLLIKSSSLVKQTTLSPTSPSSIAFEGFFALHELLHLVKHHYLPLLNQQDATQMERLFCLKKMEALVMQSSTQEKGIVNGVSIAESRKVARFSEQHAGEQEIETVYLNALGKFGMRQGPQDLWKGFVENLSLEKRGELIEKMKVLDQHRLIPFFMNVLLKKLAGGSGSIATQEEAEVLLQGIDKEVGEAQGAFQAIEERDQALKEMEGSKEQWGQDEGFDRRLSTLKERLTTLGFSLPNSPWPKQFTEASSLGKMAILQLMSRSVTCYDETIKQLTGSGEYKSDITKAKHFHALLENYMNMLEIHMDLCKTQEGHEKELMSISTPESEFKIREHTFEQFLKKGKNLFEGENELVTTSLQTHLSRCGSQLESAMTEEEAKKMLEVSPTFSVAAIAVGSRTDLSYGVVWPESLEEIFTTIHQSTEAINKFEQTQLGYGESIVPERLSGICTSFKNSGFSISRIDISYPAMEVIYQIPLRQHAMQVAIVTDLSKPQNLLEIKVHAFGKEEENRWAKTAFLGSLLAHCVPGCSFSAGPPSIYYPDPSGAGVSFTLKVDADKCSQVADGQSVVFLENFGQMVKEWFCEEGAIFDTLKPYAEGFLDDFKSRGLVINSVLGNRFSSEDVWFEMPEKVYEDSLYFNAWALSQVYEKQPKKMIGIAKATLLALKKYGMNGAESSGSSYLGNNPLRIAFYTDENAKKFLKQVNPITVSSGIAKENTMFETVALALYSAIGNPSAQEVMRQLTEDPEIKAAFPKLISTLVEKLNAGQETMLQLTEGPETMVPVSEEKLNVERSSKQALEDPIVVGDPMKELSALMEKLAETTESAAKTPEKPTEE